jgi:cytoskeletal protein RodZ
MESDMSTAAIVQQGPASVRLQKGISLAEIAENTKIGIHYLEAIEHERFRDLPGGIYSISYIRQYARAVGMSEHALLDRCLETLSGEEKDNVLATLSYTKISRQRNGRD